jgi:protein-disulfide isomerase
MRQIVFCAALALWAAPAAAFDPANMSEPEREAFGQAVREYLLANPQLVYEMLAAIESERIASGAADDRTTIDAKAAELFDNPGDPVLGNPEGDVPLVMFTDYRCPYCRATEADLAAMVADDPDLKVVIKHYPVLAPDSTVAAAFALAVLDLGGEAAHAAVHHRLYGLRGGYTKATLGSLAEELGLDPEAVFTRMESDEVVQRISANLKLGKEFGFDATPSFVLPGLLVKGQVPAEALRRYVDEARARAQD